MTNTNLRSILLDARSSLRTYRHPDLSVAQSRLGEIIEAAGLGAIGNARISDISIDASYVCVDIEYSVRGCISGDSYEFPVSILDSADPMLAATRWGLERKRDMALHEIEQAKLSLAGWEATLVDAEGKLAALG